MKIKGDHYTEKSFSKFFRSNLPSNELTMKKSKSLFLFFLWFYGIKVFLVCDVRTCQILQYSNNTFLLLIQYSWRVFIPFFEYNICLHPYYFLLILNIIYLFRSCGKNSENNLCLVRRVNYVNFFFEISYICPDHNFFPSM